MNDLSAGEVMARVQDVLTKQVLLFNFLKEGFFCGKEVVLHDFLERDQHP